MAAEEAHPDTGSEPDPGDPRGQGRPRLTFLDSSLIVGILLGEPAGSRAEARLAREERLLVSSLALVEFRSAICRKRREGGFPVERLDELEEAFGDRWASFERIPVADPVLDRAAALLRRHPLRSLDAIQLASAVLAAGETEEPLRFGSLDARLNAAARAEGLAIL